MRSLTKMLVLSLVLALGTTFVFMLQFKSGYSSSLAIENVDAFKRQYQTGVYAYRPLAREILLQIDRMTPEKHDFVLARTILIGVGVAAFNIFFLLLLRELRIRREHDFTSLLLLDLFIGFTLYVRGNAYTVPALVFIYAAACFAEKRQHLLMLTMILLGSLTHEITLLAVVYIVARAWLRRDDSIPAASRRRERQMAVIALGIWSMTYILLRVVVETQAEGRGLFQSITLEHNLALGPAIVSALVVVICFGLLDRAGVKRLRARGYDDLLVTFSSIVPYAIYMAVVGLLVEIRLFLPFIPLLLLMNLLGRPGEAGPIELRQSTAVGHHR